MAIVFSLGRRRAQQYRRTQVSLCHSELHDQAKMDAPVYSSNFDLWAFVSVLPRKEETEVQDSQLKHYQICGVLWGGAFSGKKSQLFGQGQVRTASGGP